MKKVIKKKTPEQLALEQEAQNKVMRDFGFQCKDMNGEPFFLPIAGGWYAMNAKCTISWADFIDKLRAFNK